MVRTSKYLPGTLLSASVVLIGVASAMQIPQFDKMAVSDKATYETLLIIGAKNALIARGQADQAQKVVDFFKDDSANGGNLQFLKNLEKIRMTNAKNASDPNNNIRPYEVEHAFFLTLKDNGITVPISVLLAINKDFKPSQPAAAVR